MLPAVVPSVVACVAPVEAVVPELVPVPAVMSVVLVSLPELPAGPWVSLAGPLASLAEVSADDSPLPSVHAMSKQELRHRKEPTERTRGEG